MEDFLASVNSENSEWGILQGTSPEGNFLIRRNNSLKQIAGHEDYPFQVGVAVSRIKPNRKSWPTKKELKLLYGIEDDLEKMLLAENNCIFAVVITSDVMREFVLYTKDKEIVIDKLEAYVSPSKRLRVQFIIQMDKNWDIYHSFGETS